jgi:hypothetical protein
MLALGVWLPLLFTDPDRRPVRLPYLEFLPLFVTTPLPHIQSTCDADLHTGYFAQLMHGMTPLFWQAPRRKRGLFQDTISDGMTPTQLPRRGTLFQGAFLEIKSPVKGVWAPIRNAFVRSVVDRNTFDAAS